MRRQPSTWAAKRTSRTCEHGDRFHFHKLDVLDRDELDRLFAAGRFEAVFHLAANSDISLGNADHSLDLRLTFQTTVEVVEAMARHGVDRLFFASTSAVFGDTRQLLSETSGPHAAGLVLRRREAGGRGVCLGFRPQLRLAGPGAAVSQRGGRAVTHGAVYDFVARLRQDPRRLRVLGNGKQTKPYLYVKDLVRAILTVVGPGHRAAGRLSRGRRGAYLRPPDRRDRRRGNGPRGAYPSSIPAATAVGWATCRTSSTIAARFAPSAFSPTYDSTQAVQVAVRRMLGKQ